MLGVADIKIKLPIYIKLISDFYFIGNFQFYSNKILIVLRLQLMTVDSH